VRSIAAIEHFEHVDLRGREPRGEIGRRLRHGLDAIAGLGNLGECPECHHHHEADRQRESSRGESGPFICYDAAVKSFGRLLLWRLGLVNVAPWADPEETACLIRHAAGKQRLAEIGVWEGGTTRMLRSAMSPNGVLHAIDPFPHGRLGLSYQRPIAHGEVSRVANGQVIWIRATGAAAAQDPRVSAAPFDFVFIDSDHSFEGLRTDWQAWAPLASDIVALHDVVGPPGNGSVRFAREHIFTDPRFTLVETAGCLAILKRTR
jgi:hypothetical protein